jgi:hypothetical protein
MLNQRFLNHFLFGIVLWACARMCWAEGVAHLVFHMGLGASGQFFIGGTLENKGDAPISHGYVVVSLLDAKCYPMDEKLYAFGPLSAGHTQAFRIPIDGRLQGYRLTAFKALDDMGFPLLAIDDTHAIIHAREVAERKKCQEARK